MDESAPTASGTAIVPVFRTPVRRGVGTAGRVSRTGEIDVSAADLQQLILGTEREK